MKKIILVLFVFVLNFTFALASFAENFYIKNYDVYMEVKKNKDVVITEEIDVYFTRPSHGIYRTIPTNGTLYREDGELVKYRAKISDVWIDNKYDTSYMTSNNVTSVMYKIGSPHKTVTGNQAYTISYTYSLGNDTLKSADEFYFNIIGTEWDTRINKVSFKIVFPKADEEFAKNIGFSLGRRGTSGYDPQYLTYSIQDNRIVTGEVNRVLTPREGLTVRTLFPGDYFEKTINPFGKEVTVVLMLIFTLIAYILWYVFGRDEKVIPVVNFYPPKNRNSAEVGVEYSGSASDKEIVSLIFYLANKGYIEIQDDEISFTLHKLKEYDGKNQFEKKLMLALFSKSDTVSSKELEYSSLFYKSTRKIISSLNKIKNHIFDKTANSWEKLFILVICVIGILICILNASSGYDISSLIETPFFFVLLFPIVGIIVVSAFVYDIVKGNKPLSYKIYKAIFITIWGSGFIGMPLIMLSQVFSDTSSDYLVALFGLICLVTSIICLVNMPKRNKKGRIALGYLMGFKQFLEVAEAHRLETLLAEDRNYASDIIAFAYVLGVADKIIPMLENLSLYEPPSWYRGKFDSNSFSRVSSKMLSSVIPSTSNGGISRSSGGSGGSGGGFSGGGSGGGGGGSW